MFGDAVVLHSPQRVAAPIGGLVGLPKRAVRYFAGRDRALEQLDELILAGASVVAQTVHGLGGIGKSELALQYANRRRDRYAVVWWVVAENPEKIEAGLAEMAFRLHSERHIIATHREAANWALAWLQSHDHWLLILYNVEDRHHVEALLGQLTRGDLLITTRRGASWEDMTDRCLRLDVLQPDAAAYVLTQVSGQPSTADVHQLAKELGYLPLALQQAGAYIFLDRRLPPWTQEAVDKFQPRPRAARGC